MSHKIETKDAARLLFGEIRILVEWAIVNDMDHKTLQEALDRYHMQ